MHVKILLLYSFLFNTVLAELDEDEGKIVDTAVRREYIKEVKKAADKILHAVTSEENEALKSLGGDGVELVTEKLSMDEPLSLANGSKDQGERQRSMGRKIWAWLILAVGSGVIIYLFIELARCLSELYALLKESKHDGIT